MNALEERLYELTLRDRPAARLLHGFPTCQAGTQALSWMISPGPEIHLGFHAKELHLHSADLLETSLAELLQFLYSEEADGISLQRFRSDWNRCSPTEKQILRDRLDTQLQALSRQFEEEIEFPGIYRSIYRTANKTDETEVPWQLLLRRFIQKQLGDRIKNTYHRRSRRYGTPPGIRPAGYHRIALAIDSSGSIPDSLLGFFLEEAGKLWRHVGSLPVIEFDHRIQRTYFYHPSKTGQAGGGGGTRFGPPIAWARQQHLHTLLLLTDGQAADPGPIPPGLEVVWILAGNPPEWMKDQRRGPLIRLNMSDMEFPEKNGD